MSRTGLARAEKDAPAWLSTVHVSGGLEAVRVHGSEDKSEQPMLRVSDCRLAGLDMLVGLSGVCAITDYLHLPT